MVNTCDVKFFSFYAVANSDFLYFSNAPVKQILSRSLPIDA